ncbi:MAG: hypothetical protein LUF29_02510 [Oscillospiraceae bacterium]|nr:hypothetical protein [Oscillospiraceae bacterium]
MSKPGKFRLDTSFEGTFNKFFDLTGDGKATIDDFIIWKQILDPDIPDTTPASTPIFSPSVSKHDWQSEATEGDDYDIDPYDYDSPDDYYDEVEMRELEEADTKPRYVSEKPMVGSVQKDWGSSMISYPPSSNTSHATSIASKYLTRNGAFLFTQAIKENFELPIELPDEDEHPEIDPCNSLRKIARYDADLALKAWNWMLGEFMPPMKELGLEPANFLACTEYVLSNLDEYPKSFVPKFKKYIAEHPDFAELLFGSFFMTYADEPMKARKPDWDLDIEDYIKDIDVRKLKARARAELQKQQEAKTDTTYKLALANAFRTGENLPKVYEFCRVLLNQSGTSYSYLTNRLDLNIGDRVIVPVGADNKELTGIVVSIEKHTALTVPYPVERVKKVLRKSIE